jgi:4'-phosphopantetheinyl transferase
LKLARNEVHVWLAFDRETRFAPAMEASASWLSPDECARHARLQAPGLQEQYLLTRALQRSVLSRYVPGIAPREWRFVAGEHGKPSLDPQFAKQELHFNLAHTAGLVAMAVARSPELGIDVENLTTRTAPLRLATRFFSAAEAAALAALPEAAQTARFFALWTLKEAWLKATGLGLAAGLANASFTLDAAHALVRFELAADEAARWKFWQEAPSADHCLAVALRSAGSAGEGASCRVFTWAGPDAASDQEQRTQP